MGLAGEWHILEFSRQEADSSIPTQNLSPGFMLVTSVTRADTFHLLRYCSLRSQQLGQNPFQITFGDGILPRMSRDFAIFMAKHLAGYYL